MGQLFGADTLTVYALAGQVTTRIELGTAVVATFSRHPLVLASQALTAQAATNNRIVLGIGSSHRALVCDTMGLDYRRPAAYLREYLQVLRPALDGQPIAHDGELIRVNTGTMGLTGVPGAGRVPIVVGTFSPNSLRIAAELADGVMTWLAGPRVLHDDVITTIGQVTTAMGRQPPRLVVGLPIAVTDKPDRERRTVARFLGPYAAFPAYRDVLAREHVEGPEDVAIIGSEWEVEHRLGQLADLGATDFYGSCTSDDPETIERTIGLLGSLAGRDRHRGSWPGP